MLLNRAEKALMNNPVRAAVQRHYEANVWLRLAGPMKGGSALEIGCGRGEGIRIILDRFGAARVDAFDLDPAMAALARERTAHMGAKVRIWTGDAEHIQAPDGSYDAVFDFGIIHHIPEWRRAVAEAARVLAPGGRFYAEEVLKKFLDRPAVKRLLDHPDHDRFGMWEFSQALDAAGLKITGTSCLWGEFGWWTAQKPVA